MLTLGSDFGMILNNFLQSGNLNPDVRQGMSYIKIILRTSCTLLCKDARVRFVSIFEIRKGAVLLLLFLFGDPSGNLNPDVRQGMSYIKIILRTSCTLLCKDARVRFVSIFEIRKGAVLLLLFLFGDPSGNRTRVSSVRG